MVFLFKRQILFTFQDHVIDLQILQGLKFSPWEIKHRTPEKKCKCQISYLGRDVWLPPANFKIASVDQSNSITYGKLLSESLKQVNYGP